MLALNPLAPPYSAVIEWLPTLNAEMLKVATPLLNVPVPRVVEPSLKVMVPVGVPELALTVAVKVTL